MKEWDRDSVCVCVCVCVWNSSSVVEAISLIIIDSRIKRSSDQLSFAYGANLDAMSVDQAKEPINRFSRVSKEFQFTMTI